MKTHFQILLAIIIVTGCNNARKSTDPAQGNNPISPVDPSRTTSEEKELFVERGRYEDAQYKIIAYSRLVIPDTLSYDSSFYFKENILSLNDKHTHHAAKIQLTNPCGPGEIIIDNVTSSLGFKSPLFEVTTPDCSDLYISEFILFRKDTLQKLFDISDARPVELTRINEHELAGTVKDRDEIVADFQDYPITVSLTDYSVTKTKPLRQEIGFETEALEEIRLSRTNDRRLKVPYIIRKGTKLKVDSIFRDTKQLRITLNDTLIIICPISEIEGKLQSNTAG